jgi:Acetyltransferase (GNAT) domain
MFSRFSYPLGFPISVFDVGSTANRRFSVSIATEADLGEWQRFASAHAPRNPFLDAAWHRILGEAFKVERFFLMCRDDQGHVVGLAPLFLSRSFITGRHLGSLEDGWCCASEEASYALLQAALSLKTATRANYLVLRGNGVPSGSADYEISTVRRIIDTSRPPDAILAAVKKTNRWHIRRANANGFVFEEDPNLERLDRFFRIYARRMRDLGVPVVSIDYMRAIKKHFGVERLKLFFASRHGCEVGGMLCLVSSNSWFLLYAAVDKDMMTQFANYLLYWCAIEKAANSGVAQFDFGRSRPGSNTQFFKSKWPGVDLSVPQYYFCGAKWPARLAIARDQQSLVREIWKRCPLAVVNLIGPILNRRLPIV